MATYWTVMLVVAGYCLLVAPVWWWTYRHYRRKGEDKTLAVVWANISCIFLNLGIALVALSGQLFVS